MLTDGEFPEPRPFQDRAHEQLRQGVRDGHRCQLILAPTGGGKTYLGMRVIKETLAKARRAMFLCDRRTLISQTSDTAERYGLWNHSIIQASHPRLDMRKNFQIASVQTLMRRGWPTDIDVIIVDECHTLYKTWVDYVTSPECKAKVIGLSATPFAPGLAEVFTNLINAATMHELTESGVLVPMRIFSCRRPDMTGAATVGGEWSDKAAEERELVLVGDVVTEWAKHARERKTICFGATIAHCAELARQFNEAGIPTAMFTSETKDDERQALLEDYRRPNSYTRVLVSVEALAKGFDVPDVECVIDARPLRKSLSTAIQMWGRGLRSSPDTGKTDCVLRGSKVLTDRGEIPIEDVLLSDNIWDGFEFVPHGGSVCKGIKDVISYAGLTATPDHPVFTEEGWRSFGDCAREQISIVQTGSGGQAIRACEGRFAGSLLVRPEAPNTHARSLRMRDLWVSRLHSIHHLGERIFRRVQNLCEATQNSTLVAGAMREYGSTLPQFQGPALAGLWGTWNRVQVQRSNGLRTLDCGEPWSSSECQGSGVGPNRQRWALRAREYPLGFSKIEHGESTSRSSHLSDAPIQAEAPRGLLRRIHASLLDCLRNVLRGHRGKVQHPIRQAQGEVWDILNCGPRHRFTCEGLLVHNCLLLDFSGNVIRFADDFSQIFFNGLEKLAEGKKLDKDIRKDEDHEPRACPQCGYQPMGKRCVGCGYEPVKKSLVEHLPGELQEIVLGGKRLASDLADLYAQLATYAKQHSLPEKQAGRAAHLYKDIVGSWPPREFSIETAPHVEPSRATLGKIKSLRIAFMHRRSAA